MIDKIHLFYGDSSEKATVITFDGESTVKTEHESRQLALDAIREIRAKHPGGVIKAGPIIGSIEIIFQRSDKLWKDILIPKEVTPEAFDGPPNKLFIDELGISSMINHKNEL